MEWWLISIILFSSMLLLLFLGVNIPFSLGFVAVVGILFLWDNPQAGLLTVANEAYHRGTNFIVLAVPMFVLLAEIIMAGKISGEAYDAISKYLCRVPGALAVTSTILSAFFAALTGSSLANAAITGRVAIREMVRYKYDKSLAGGVIVGGGVLGILIPPSLPMIFYSMFSEESVSKLFMAGLFPGILSALLMIVYIIIYSKLKPAVAPALPRVSFIAAVKASYKLFPMVFLIVTMFYAFYAGIATTTEIGAFAAFCALLIVILYRRLHWADIKQCWLRTAHTTLMLLWILVGALAFGTVLAYAELPQHLTELVIGLPLSPIMLIIAINIFMIFLGCILETGAIMMVVWPLLIIVAQALGWDLIWFAVILVIQMELGQITPPVGIVLFGMSAIAPEVSVTQIYKGVLPFVFIQVVVLCLIIAFPEIVLWLPSHM